MIKKVKTEPIPERVLEFCRIIATNRESLSDKDISEILEPSTVDVSQQSIISHIKEAALELNLVAEDDKGKLSLIVEKNVLKTFDSFRFHCNKEMYSNVKSEFYSLVKCILNSNDAFLDMGSFTSSEYIKSYVRCNSNLIPEPKRTMEGIRFWISFLGFGYIIEHSDKTFLPNAYVALKDFVCMAEFEKRKIYSVSEFVALIRPFAHILLPNEENDKIFNLAMSNALRQMHDNKEIELIHMLDSLDYWELFENNNHLITKKLTHIKYKGVSKE